MNGSELVQRMCDSDTDGDDFNRRRRLLLDYIINLEYKSNIVAQLREMLSVSENRDALHLLSAMSSVQTELAELKGLDESKMIRLKAANVTVKRADDGLKQHLGSEYSKIESAMERLMAAVEEITLEKSKVPNVKYAIIFNGQFTYELVVNDEFGSHKILFTSMDTAEYFEMMYIAMGYKVMRLGDGHGCYQEYATDYLKSEDLTSDGVKDV